ncbi:hypothetical protein BCBBV1cgp15 [Bacillus phage BCASJ1c]|uniref:15 n=1 Tax=Bacillus phage BCASJ1c TaxID=294382 RepID=Q5YA95_9CAUD|nr:hypothetical protein BCBBV1cgp15 [Bacillus phage BCASJ1c]AAU85062.1 15 [Bacillus phage BCASJ1c]
MSQNMERELGWDDEIEKDGPAFVLLPPGEYNFTVAKFERGRFQGSEKMPPCNEAKLDLTIHSPEHGDVTLFHRLLLHTKTEGFLSNFFAGIGQKKPGERLRMNWNAVVGSKGRCKIEHNKYMSKGEERVNNQVQTFLPYEEYLKHSSQQQGQAQQGYQQPPQQNQAPFPTGQGQSQQGGFTPGQF